MSAIFELREHYLPNGTIKAFGKRVKIVPEGTEGRYTLITQRSTPGSRRYHFHWTYEEALAHCLKWQRRVFREEGLLR